MSDQEHFVSEEEIITVRPSGETMTKQRLPNFVGISGATAGARGISMNMIINQSGDFIFIPANVPHQPVNLSATEPVYAIVARNDPNEQESVVPYEA